MRLKHGPLAFSFLSTFMFCLQACEQNIDIATLATDDTLLENQENVAALQLQNDGAPEVISPDHSAGLKTMQAGAPEPLANDEGEDNPNDLPPHVSQGPDLSDGGSSEIECYNADLKVHYEQADDFPLKGRKVVLNNIEVNYVGGWFNKSDRIKSLRLDLSEKSGSLIIPKGTFPCGVLEQLRFEVRPDDQMASNSIASQLGRQYAVLSQPLLITGRAKQEINIWLDYGPAPLGVISWKPKDAFLIKTE